MDKDECLYARKHRSAFYLVFSSIDVKNLDLGCVFRILISVPTLRRNILCHFPLFAFW
jgi:hypothetical protein